MNNDSDTSAEMDMNILDNNDNKIDITQQNNQENPKIDVNLKKPESSDTDYYLNLLANQDKLNDDSDNKSNVSSSSLSEIIESEEESDESESESEESDKEKSSEKSSNSSSKAKSNALLQHLPSLLFYFPKVDLHTVDIKSHNILFCCHMHRT